MTLNKRDFDFFFCSSLKISYVVFFMNAVDDVVMFFVNTVDDVKFFVNTVDDIRLEQTRSFVSLLLI